MYLRKNSCASYPPFYNDLISKLNLKKLWYICHFVYESDNYLYVSVLTILTVKNCSYREWGHDFPDSNSIFISYFGNKTWEALESAPVGKSLWGGIQSSPQILLVSLEWPQVLILIHFCCSFILAQSFPAHHVSTSFLIYSLYIPWPVSTPMP